MNIALSSNICLVSHRCCFCCCFRLKQNFASTVTQQGDVNMMLNRRTFLTTAVMVLSMLASTVLIDEVETLGMLLTQTDYDSNPDDAVISYNR